MTQAGVSVLHKSMVPLSDIKKIERVQEVAAKMVLGNAHLSYQQRLKSLIYTHSFIKERGAKLLKHLKY